MRSLFNELINFNLANQLFNLNLTCGVWCARDLVPLTSTRFSCRSSLSELELNTHSNLRSTEGFAMTSHETRIRSRLATPYTWIWSGLQKGMSGRKEENRNGSILAIYKYIQSCRFVDCVNFSLRKVAGQGILRITVVLSSN
jgi:hypothetical protein